MRVWVLLSMVAISILASASCALPTMSSEGLSADGGVRTDGATNFVLKGKVVTQ